MQSSIITNLRQKSNSSHHRLNAISMSDEAHILYTNTKKPVGLERVIVMIQSSEQSFLTQEDGLIEESKFEKWFTAGKIASGLTFLFSLMGIVMLVLHDVYYAVGRPPKLTFDAYDNTSESGEAPAIESAETPASESGEAAASVPSIWSDTFKLQSHEFIVFVGYICTTKCTCGRTFCTIRVWLNMGYLALNSIQHLYDAFKSTKFS